MWCLCVCVISQRTVFIIIRFFCLLCFQYCVHATQIILNQYNRFCFEFLLISGNVWTIVITSWAREAILAHTKIVLEVWIERNLLLDTRMCHVLDYFQVVSIDMLQNSNMLCQKNPSKSETIVRWKLVIRSLCKHLFAQFWRA